MIRLEHANICVTEIEPMIKFLQTINDRFRIRGDGKTSMGTKWVHVGDDDTYFALQLAKKGSKNNWTPYSGEPGVNHLAFEVDDVDALRDRLAAAGYEESTVPNSHPFRKRVYFYDPEGNDWEFVQYFSDDPKERNDYDTPDK